MFPGAPEIKVSHNYDQFRFIKWNRDIDRPNLLKLIEENRQKFQLHKFPILVTRDFKIIDGQHRFEAMKEIGCPIYYILSEDLDESFASVQSVNRAGKRLTRGDLIDMMYKAGDPEADFVYKTFNLYQGLFPKTVIFTVLSNLTEGGSVTRPLFANNKMVLQNKEAGLEVLDALFYSNIPDKGKQKTVMGLGVIAKKSGVNPKTIVRRVQENLIKYIIPKSKEDAIRSMLICYNYGLKTNRITLPSK